MSIEYNTRITKKLADKYGITTQTLRNWCRQYKVDGEPIGKKIGNSWFVNKKYIDLAMKGKVTFTL